MRSLMFGWEFPPHISGELGTACFSLTKGLTEKGVDVTFVIPSLSHETQVGHVKLVGSDTVRTLEKVLDVYQQMCIN